MSEGLREADTIGGERIECGSFNLLVSVAADMIGAQRVDGDEEDVGERARGAEVCAQEAVPSSVIPANT